MRIGFDAKRLFHNCTGLGNYSRDLLRMLHMYYPENEYVLFNPRVSKRSFPTLEGISFTEINPRGMWKKMSSVWRTYGMRNEILNQRVDIFHGLSGELPLGLSGRVKTVVTIHDLIFLRYPELYHPIDAAIYRRKYKYAAQHADRVVAISEQTKSDIHQFFQIPLEKIQVIYQGCDSVFKKSYSEEVKKFLRQKYQLPKRFILQVGTLEKRKNALNVVKAIASLDTVLVLVGGKTPYFQEIEQYVATHQLSHKVIHLQGVTMEELAALYQMADIFVYPSVFEGFGIPIIEALFSKTPVITNASGVFPEAAGPGAQYVDVHQVEELRTALSQLLDHPELREELIQKGTAYIQKFSEDTLAQQWMTLYQNLLV